MAINSGIMLMIGILDIDGLIVVRALGAYYGLAASWELLDRRPNLALHPAPYLYRAFQ